MASAAADAEWRRADEIRGGVHQRLKGWRHQTCAHRQHNGERDLRAHKHAAQAPPRASGSAPRTERKDGITMRIA
jgi:hypothetical protein